MCTGRKTTRLIKYVINKTMSKRVDSEQYYVTFEMFVADARRMFANARTYNSPETIYYKCSTRHVLVLPPPGWV